MEDKLAPEDLLLRIASASQADLEKLALRSRPKAARPVSEVTLASALRETATAAYIRNGVLVRVAG